MRNYSKVFKSFIVAFLIVSFSLTSSPGFTQTLVDVDTPIEGGNKPVNVASQAALMSKKVDNISDQASENIGSSDDESVGLLEKDVKLDSSGENPDNSPEYKMADNETIVKSNIFRGGVHLNVQEDKLFTGEKKEVKKGSKVELTVSTVIGSNVSMEGDEFFAEVTDEYMVDGGVLIPIGTVAHGSITEAQEERRLGRNGYVTIKFDYLITPDGREIPIDAKMSTKSHPVKSFAKVALTDAGYTLAGGALGGLLALKVGGLAAAVASHGYTIAGGAALGGTIGAAQSLIRKGKPTMINPGDKINMKITTNMELPVIKNSAVADKEKELAGLSVEIYDCDFEKDPFGTPNTITLGVDIVNRTDNTFTFFDVALVDEYGGMFYPSPFGDTSMWFQKIKPGCKLSGELSFSVNNYKQKHWLVFYDKYNRKELAKISVRNALRKIKADKASKKKRNKS